METPRRFFVPAALVGAILTASALPATAAPKARLGCQSGFNLVQVDYVLARATPGFEDAIREMDHNKDSQLCYKELPSAVPLFDPTFLYYDNDKPLH